MKRCVRCGDRFEGHPDARYCMRCFEEVKAILEADAQRRVERFPARDLTERRGAA